MRIKIIGGDASLGPVRFEYEPGFEFCRDSECEEYDWLVVYDELNRGDGRALECRCPREHTILATWEPVSIKHYSRAYTRQFGHLLSNRPWDAEKHPHYHLGRGYFEWFNDRSYQENLTTVLPPKTRTISVVCSSKRMKRTRHNSRFELVAALAEAIPDFEWYGHGVRGFGKKYEVMDPYRYHVAVENHIGEHHWTEKLADAFLCECLPFYAGDPKIFEIFPAESIIPIPIDDPVAAVRIVREAIAAGEYEKRREAVLEAKRLILTKYNFWAQVIEVIRSSARAEVSAGDVPFPLYNRKSLRKRSISAALEDGYRHLIQYLSW